MRIRNFVYWLRGDAQLPLLRMAVDSVRRTNPMARVYVMAEGVTPAPIDGVSWWPCKYGTPLMLANLQAQCEFMVSARNERGATAFLDVDTLVLAELVGLPAADLIVTYRDHVAVKDGEKVEGIAKLMPYNYGVVFAGETVGAKDAFIWLRDRIAKYHAQLQDWYGNQRALAELAGPSPKEPCTRKRKLPLREIDVAYLPCERWNYTPESADEDLSSRGIVHFKGGRKDMMEAVYRRMTARSSVAA